MYNRTNGIWCGIWNALWIVVWCIHILKTYELKHTYLHVFENNFWILFNLIALIFSFILIIPW